MSPVVRVVARPEGDRRTPPVPWRLRLRLDELVLAARLAGDVPLPLRLDGSGAVDRVSDRLAGTPLSVARARSSLGDRGLLAGDDVEPALATALGVLAGGPLGAVLDVSATRRAGTSRLRSWFGAAPGLVAQLSTGDGLEHELAWFDPALWASQVTRAATVEPWVAGSAPLALPDHVSLPSDLLAGSAKAYREGRADLVPVMAATHAGQVRLGEVGAVREADSGEAVAVLETLGTACRGRLRLVTLRRDRAERPAVTAWLLFDDGWHELRPGRDATSVLRRRETGDLGLLTWPIVAAATGEAS